MKNKWAYWLLSLALIVGVYLMVDRTRERTVGQVCPELKEATACTLSTVIVNDSGTRTLEGEELNAFVDHFAQVICRSEGTAAGNTTYEGQLYLVYLTGKDGQNVDIKLTNQGYLQIGNRGYSFQPEEFCGYLDSELEPPDLENMGAYKAQ